MADNILIGIDLGANKVKKDLNSIHLGLSALDKSVSNIQKGFTASAKSAFDFSRSLTAISNETKTLSNAYTGLYNVATTSMRDSIQGAYDLTAALTGVKTKVESIKQSYTGLDSLISQAKVKGVSATNTGPDLVGQFKQQAFAANKAKVEYKKLDTVIQEAAGNVIDYGLANENLVRNFARTAARAQEAEKKINLLSRVTNAASGAFKRMGAGLKDYLSFQAMATRASEAFVSNIFRMIRATGRLFKNMALVSSEFLGFRNRLLGATGSINLAEDALATATKIALEHRTAIKETVGSYAKFITATNIAGMSMEGATDIFKSFSRAARVMNLSGMQVQNMFVALEQMVSKGTVSMEELRRQLGNAVPGAMSIAAKAYKGGTMSVKEFYNEVAKGNVFTKDLLPEMAKEMDKMFAVHLPKALETLHAALTNLNNVWTLLSKSIGDNLAPTLADIINIFSNVLMGVNNLIGGSSELNKNLNEINYTVDSFSIAVEDTSVALNKTSDAFGGMATASLFLIGTTTGLSSAYAILSKTLGFLLAPLGKFGAAILGIGGYFAILKTKVIAATIAIKGFMLSNPITAFFLGATIAITGFIAGMRKLNESSIKAAEGVKNLKTRMEEYAAATKAAMEVTNDLARNFSLSSVALYAMEDAYEVTKAKLDGAKSSLELWIRLNREGSTEYKHAQQQVEALSIKLEGQKVALDGARTALDENRKAWLDYNNQSDDAIANNDGLSKSFTDLRNKLVDQINELQLTSRAFYEYELRVAGVRDAKDKLTETEIQALMTLWDTKNALEEQAKALKKVSETAKEVIEPFDKIKQSLVDQLHEITLTEREYYKYTLMMKELTPTQIEYAMSVWDTVDALKKLKEADLPEVISGAAEETDRFSEYMRTLRDDATNIEGVYISAFGHMEDAMTDFIVNGKANFHDMAKAILADLARMIVKQMIYNAISSAMGGAFGQIGSAAANPFRGVGAPVSSASAVYSVPQLAKGTNYVPNDGYAYLHKGEAVVPAKENKTMSNKTPMVININIEGVQDYSSFQRNETQITNSLQQQLAIANRNL